MPILRRFAASVTETGEVRLADPIAWRARLARLRGKRVWLTVDKEALVRSPSQNRLMWGWHLAILAEYTGYTVEELHQVFRWRHLRREILLPGGEVAETTRSTTELSIEEFSEYLRKIERDGAEMGCAIPDPESCQAVIA